MQIKGKVWFSLSLGIAVLVAAGCGKSKTEPAVQEMSPSDRYISEAIEKAESGQVDQALAHLDKGLAELKDSGDRARLFSLQLSFMLNNGRPDDAKARYLAALKDEPGLAQSTLGMIEDRLSQQPNGHDAVLAWCDQLEAAGLPDDMKNPVLQNRLSALLALGAFDKALGLIDERGWPLADDLAASMYGRHIQAAIGAGKFEEAGRGIDVLETRGAKRAGMAALAAASRIDVALAQNQPAAAADLLLARAAAFDDGTSANILDRIARTALSDKKPEVCDAIIEKFLAAMADRPSTRSRAARWYLVRARDAENLDMALDRLEKLEAMGLPPAQLAAGINTVSQLVLAPATPNAAVARLMGYVTALKPRVTEEADVSLLAGVQLDAGFRLEDYAALVKVLEAGVPGSGHDEAWHKTMLNKIKAHLDLKEGRIDEAVARFREFMASIEAQEDQGYRDPVTDERVTKPMILGYNEKRIGEIYAKAGRQEDAAKAYSKAKAHYEKALEGFSEKDPEYKTVSAILAELGKD
jgi:tetratricopeptide (TPR) repeat protein